MQGESSNALSQTCKQQNRQRNVSTVLESSCVYYMLLVLDYPPPPPRAPPCSATAKMHGHALRSKAFKMRARPPHPTTWFDTRSHLEIHRWRVPHFHARSIAACCECIRISRPMCASKHSFDVPCFRGPRNRPTGDRIQT